MSAEQDRARVCEKYSTILGRNKYSQAKRSYVFKKYSDGKYYSDCSSSIAATYRECGLPITYGGSTLPNTVGMYLTKDMTEVPVTIEGGVIQNPELLRPGDCLLFAGSDSGRAYAGYVGHVEMVARIDENSGKIILYGHGSGTPRETEMNAYCKSRYRQKTSTKLGHKGLIKVVRRIQDAGEGVAPEVAAQGAGCVRIVNCTCANLRTGPGTQFRSVGTCRAGDVFPAPDASGWVPVVHGGEVRWVSGKYAQRGEGERLE